MRVRFSVMLVWVIMFALLVEMSVIVASAQVPTATPTVAASPEPDAAPRFGIVPVGKYPGGFFKDVEVSPGETMTLEVMVINAGTESIDLRIYKTNAHSGVNGGFVAGEEGETPENSTAWIDFPTVTMTLQAQSQESIGFAVSVPPETQPGQYVAGLVVETADTLPIEGTNVFDQRMRFAMTVGILVPGELETSFQLGDPILDEQVLAIPLENTGNYLVRPEGELVLTDDSGRSVLVAPVKMGSVYSGLSTLIYISVPDQLPPGNYSVDLTVSDPESGATDSLADGTSVTVPEPIDTTGISIADAAIDANAEEIVFANVDVTLNNGGQQIPASNVTLEVIRDGELVESFPLATNQLLLSGENALSARYIPAETWEPGTYTFSIVVSAVDPNGGQETILLDEELDATIVVP